MNSQITKKFTSLQNLLADWKKKKKKNPPQIKREKHFVNSIWHLLKNTQKNSKYNSLISF